MNSSQRIQNTLDGRAVDRRAFTMVLSLYGARLTGCSIEKYFSDAAEYARGQSAVRETFQPDILFAPVNYASIGAAFGSELHLYANAVPNLKRPVACTAAEWDMLDWPDPDSNPRLLFFREAVRRMREEHHGEVPVAVVLPSPMDLPILVMGLDSWMETVLFDRDGAERVMSRVIPFFVRFANNLFEDGAAALVLSCVFSTPTIVTRDIAKDFSCPILGKTLSQMKGSVVIYPGAPILPHLDLLTGMPSVAGFSLLHWDDLASARKVVGADPVLFGGLDCSSFASLSSEAVESGCRSILTDRGKDPRFILSSTGPDVAWDTPPENLHAMRRAVECP